MGIFDKIKKAATFALDLTSAVAFNPLAIISPVKSAEKIKELRTTGTKEERKSYVKTVAVQTALNVGGTLAAGGLLGKAAASTVTNIGSKAITLGVVSAPLVVGSSTIRETVASFSPVAAGVKLGETIERGIKKGSEDSSTAAKVLGTAAAGGVVAAGVIGAGYLYDKLTDDKPQENLLPTSQNLPTSQSLTTIPTNEQKPILPETQEIELGTTKRKKRSKVKQMPNNISQRVNINISQNNNPTKLKKKKYLNAVTL